MANFRLVHISDLHLGEKTDYYATHEGLVLESLWAWFNSGKNYALDLSTYDSDAASGLLDYINDQVRDSYVDAILLTGDVSASGREADFTLAKTLFSGRDETDFDLLGLKHRLGDHSSTQVWPMPGNHDRFDPNNYHLPRTFAFEEHFGSDWCANLAQSRSVHTTSDFVKARLCEKDGEILCICFADFTLSDWSHAEAKSPLGMWGAGYAYYHVLADLISTTKSIRRENSRSVVLWAVHFPPELDEEKLKVKRSLKLINGSRLVKAAVNNHVPLLFAGHIHTGTTYYPEYSRSAVCAVLSGATLSTSRKVDNNAPSNSFNDVQLEIVDGELKQFAVQNVIWSPQVGSNDSLTGWRKHEEPLRNDLCEWPYTTVSWPIGNLLPRISRWLQRPKKPQQI